MDCNRLLKPEWCVLLHSGGGSWVSCVDTLLGLEEQITLRGSEIL